MSEAATEDRRVRRTRKALWTALLELLHEHSWDDINIRMICDRADVARSSFYVHFRNKSALLDFGFAGTVQELEGMIEQNTMSNGPLGTLDWLVDHIASDTRFFQNVFQTASNYAVFRRFSETLKLVLHTELKARNHIADTIAVTYLVGGSFAIIQEWIAQGQNTSSAELKGCLHRYALMVVPDIG